MGSFTLALVNTNFLDLMGTSVEDKKGGTSGRGRML